MVCKNVNYIDGWILCLNIFYSHHKSKFLQKCIQRMKTIVVYLRHRVLQDHKSKKKKLILLL